MMTVPFSNRTATFILLELALKDQPRLSYNCKELIADLSTQVANLKHLVECFLWITNSKIRVTFKTSAIMEDVLHSGLKFRNHPIEMKPTLASDSGTKRVTVLRLAYGIPNEELARFFLNLEKLSAFR